MRRLLLLLAFFSPSVFASAYTYTGQYISDSLYFTTPEAVCDAILEWRQNELPLNYSYSFTGLGTFSNDVASCQGSRYSVPSGDLIQNNVVLGKVYRTQCMAGVADTLDWPFGVKNPEVGEVLEQDAILPPWPVCASGCMVNKVSSPPYTESCYSLPDEDQSKVYCTWNAQRTGDACATTDEPTPPELPACASGYVMGANGCETAPPPDPCETDPQATGCDGGTDPGDGGTDPGDGGDTGGGDTGGGDTGGGDTGGGDTGGGDTGGDTGGDSGADTGSVAGLPCDATLACSGDAIQCAMLQTVKEQKCLNESVWDWNSQKGDVESYVAAQSEGPDFDEGEGDVNVAGLFDEAVNTRFLPAACPPPETVSLITAGGRNFEFTYEPLCQLASDFSYLIVLAASIFFAVYVGRSMGGE